MTMQVTYKKPAYVKHHEEVLNRFDNFNEECPIESVQDSLDFFAESYADLLARHNEMLESTYRFVKYQEKLLEKYGPLHHVEVMGCLAAIDDIYERAIRD